MLYRSIILASLLLAGAASAQTATQTPPPSDVSVLNFDKHENVIRERGLKIIYRGQHSDVVVAVRGDLERPNCGVN